MCTIILRNKGQLRLFESIAVLLVLFFLFAFGMQYYGAYQHSQLERMGQQFSQIDSIKISTKVIGSPYLVCSDLNIRSGLCVDLYKMRALKEFDDVELELGMTTITIVKTYPIEERVVVYNRTPTSYRNKITSHFPVIINDPFDFKNAFGFILIEIYEGAE